MALNIPDEILKRITRRQWATLWGQKRMIKPVFIEQTLGDGNKLVAITPLNTRPNYYLIRVDSKWWMDSEFEPWNAPDRNPELHMAEHIDDICEIIEDEVGGRWTEDDEGNDVMNEWPALNDDAGVSWCNSMDLLAREAGR